jgi:uncharacterized protein YbjT (DUF2867 family)
MERILVTRANGYVGREVVRRLLGRGVEVLAGAAEPHEAHELFAGADVDVVELDYLRTETYDAATMSADRVFLVPPPFDPRADENLIPFLDWAVSAGVGHVVLLSAMGIEWRAHVALRRVERRVREIGVPHTFLRPNWYMQNFLAGPVQAQISERGSFAVPAGDAALSFVDIGEVADAAAAVLAGIRHFGKAYTLTGPRALTHHDAARMLSDAAGREIRYRPIDDETLRRQLEQAGWTAERSDIVIGLFRSMRGGDRAKVTDDLPRLLGREATDFATFAATHAAAFRQLTAEL